MNHTYIFRYRKDGFTLYARLTPKQGRKCPCHLCLEFDVGVYTTQTNVPTSAAMDAVNKWAFNAKSEAMLQAQKDSVKHKATKA